MYDRQNEEQRRRGGKKDLKVQREEKKFAEKNDYGRAEVSDAPFPQGETGNLKKSNRKEIRQRNLTTEIDFERWSNQTSGRGNRIQESQKKWKRGTEKAARGEAKEDSKDEELSVNETSVR